MIHHAIVLAGGMGTRLGHHTREKPKPLLAVGGEPFLLWLLRDLANKGIQGVTLTVGYKAEAFEEFLSMTDLGVDVCLFVEATPLGTGGALPLIELPSSDTVAVVNGDTLFDVPLQDLGRRLDRTGCDVAMALTRRPDAGRFGSVRLEDGVVRAFSEKAANGPGWVSGGVYVFRTDTLCEVPSPCSLETDVLAPWSKAGRVCGAAYDGFFIDIGVPESFADAQAAVPEWAGTRFARSD